jgi:phosphate starvation-inducible PhoH-like protein
VTTPESLEIRLDPVDNHRLNHLCGPLDENLRQMERALDVTISRRGETFRVAGSPEATQLAASVINRIYARAEHPVGEDDVQLALVECRMVGRVDDSPAIATRRGEVRGRTPRQIEYLRAIQGHDITFGIGPAGTGKTYLAVACAVDALEREQVKRLVLVRPAVEAGERLGFLPGDLVQKVDPYLRPLYDALYDLLGFDRVTRMFERNAIEVAPLAFMRGRTLNHAFIILDEAQNTTPEQMKMFLTRIGFGTRAAITGDITQIDLPKGARSGLIDATEVLEGVSGIAFTQFGSEDVVRHPLVQKIVNAYAQRRPV